MNVEILKTKWDELSTVPKSGYVSIRIDGICIPDLFIGKNSDGNRCLILEIAPDIEVKFKQLSKENLRAYFHKQEQCIILELLDGYYFELFNELIVSLYNVLSQIKDPRKSTDNFILTINKWAAFLSGKKSKDLTEEELKGVIGELVCLDWWIRENRSEEINLILEGWRGPYGETYDFEFEDMVIEVKSKSVNSSEIRISNEYQLDPLPSKRLSLCVVTLKPDHNGFDIDVIVDSIRNDVLSLGGDITIFYSALAKKDLGPNTFSNYKQYRYKIPEVEMFNASSKDFPALRKSDLKSGIRNLRYTLSLADCNDYLEGKYETNWK